MLVRTVVVRAARNTMGKPYVLKKDRATRSEALRRGVGEFGRSGRSSVKALPFGGRAPHFVGRYVDNF